MKTPQPGDMVTVTVYPLWYKLGDGTGCWLLNGTPMESSADFIPIPAIQVSLVVPMDFNPVAHEVASIEKAKKKALDEYNETVAALNQRLSPLLALEG